MILGENNVSNEASVFSPTILEIRGAMPKILIFGALPPPIGGIGVHLIRTIRHLERSELDYEFLDYTRTPLTNILKSFLHAPIVHAHFSNSYLRFVCALFCRLLRKKYIFTFHGNLGRYSRFKNAIDRISIRLANVPIFLNQDSHSVGIQLNRASRLVTAFVPPDEVDPLPLRVIKQIEELVTRSHMVFSTSAHNYVACKDGSDLYGIKALCDIFSQQSMAHLSLIISDPSAKNLKEILKYKHELPNNILFIDRPHSLIEVIKKSNAYIRATSTDGDALSVCEALYLNIPVIASACVSRPEGCILYPTGDSRALSEILYSFEMKRPKRRIAIPENGVLKIIRLYKEIQGT